jgi:kynurenine formamidase
MTQGSNWGDFGRDDQCGRLNLLTPEKVRQGVAEVVEGLTFCLSLPLDLPGGNYHELSRVRPELRAVWRGGRYAYNLRPDPSLTDVWCDDVVTLSTQGSTQWDALCHVGAVFDADGDGAPEPVYYNGWRAGADVPDPLEPGGQVGARALGIEHMAARCVQGRGVLIDLHRAFGPARRLVGYDDLMRCCAATGAVVEPGDMVCLHTGLAAALAASGPEPPVELLERSHCALDSRDPRLLRWIDESGLAVLAADNFAVEAVPARPDPAATSAEPLHELCIFKLGIHLGELWHLSELSAWLAAHGRSRFLLTAPPLRLRGAAGSPVTPVATV